MRTHARTIVYHANQMLPALAVWPSAMAFRLALRPAIPIAKKLLPVESVQNHLALA